MVNHSNVGTCVQEESRKSSHIIITIWASLIAQLVKHLPAMQETWVRSLGQEDPLEKEMATHSSILAWRIPWTEKLGGLQSTGHKESDMTERLHFHFHFQVAHLVKNLPANAGDTKDMGLILGQEDPLRWEMATHSSIRAWKVQWTEQPGRLQSVGSQIVRYD